MTALMVCRYVLVCLLVSLLLFGCASRPAPTIPPSPQPQAASNALFVDVAAKAGVPFTHANGATGQFHFDEFSPAGCAFLDYDNDGFLDIFLVQSGSSEPPPSVKDRPRCALYHNNGNGTFIEVTAGSGLDKDLGYAHGVAVGD